MKKRLNSRAKGARGERLAAGFLTKCGFPAERAARNGVNAGEDVICKSLAIGFEVKFDMAIDVGTVALRDAWMQAYVRIVRAGEADSVTPMVLWRKNRSWRLTWQVAGEDILVTVGQSDIKAILSRERYQKKGNDVLDTPMTPSDHRDIRFGPRDVPIDQESIDRMVTHIQKRRHMKMRAKFVVSEVTDNGYSDKVKMNAVYGGVTNAEDNTYSKATPSGDLTMQIDNPAVRGQIKPGQKFYLDFTPAE